MPLGEQSQTGGLHVWTPCFLTWTCDSSEPFWLDRLMKWRGWQWKSGLITFLPFRPLVCCFKNARYVFVQNNGVLSLVFVGALCNLTISTHLHSWSPFFPCPPLPPTSTLLFVFVGFGSLFNKMISSSIHYLGNKQHHFVLNGWIIIYCEYIAHVIYPFICQWFPRLISWQLLRIVP